MITLRIEETKYAQDLVKKLEDEGYYKNWGYICWQSWIELKEDVNLTIRYVSDYPTIILHRKGNYEVIIPLSKIKRIEVTN